MKNTKLFSTLGAALLLAPVTITLAQSPWKTVADFECALPAAVDALTKDAAGNLYAAVSTADAQSRMHAQVQKSSDRGATWTVVEDFVHAGQSTTRFLSVGGDATDNLYAAGYTENGKGETRWIVRKGGNGGNSWSTVDDFAWPGGKMTVAQGFATDSAGNLYAAGYGDESPSDGKPGRRMHWLVRQSRDGGRNWSTIDDFAYGFSAKVYAIVSTSNGLFVAGSGWNSAFESGERWLVRKGTPDDAGGFHWQTVDELQSGEPGQWSHSRASALGVDVRGSLYAVGRSYGPTGGQGKAHWIVRRASNEGLNWTVVDTFQLEPGCFAAARGVAASERGGVFVVGFVVGQAADGNSDCHWIVRQSATGETGSWSVSDKFRGASPPGAELARMVAGEADGSLTSPLGEVPCGLAILSDSTRLFAGGSVRGALNHAIVRRLELGRTNELSIARAP